MRANCKINIERLIFIAVICLVTSQAPAAEFAGGTGEPNDPYQIATAEQLISIGDDPNLLDKHYVLVNDIDLDPNLPGGQIFTRAVIASDLLYPFTGDFNGNGCKIMNLKIHVRGWGGLGLFGWTFSPGRIFNLGLENISISPEISFDDVGGLVGHNGGTIESCYTTGNISGNGSGLGGIVGRNTSNFEGFGGIITNCYSTVNITSGDNAWRVGGLVGENSIGKVINCYSETSITVGDNSSSIGGLVGNNMGVINNCYTIGSLSIVDDSYAIGGLVGYNFLSSITNCYAATSFSYLDKSRSNIGGLLGFNWLCTIINSYFLSFYNGGGPDNGLGLPLTDEQMKQQDSFVGWDFDEIWMICEGIDYPRLQFQKSQCGE